MNGHDYLSHGAGLLDYLSRYHPHGSQALKVVNDSEGSAMVVQASGREFVIVLMNYTISEYATLQTRTKKVVVVPVETSMNPYAKAQGG